VAALEVIARVALSALMPQARLLEDYLARRQPAARFFAHPFGEPDCFKAAAQARDEQPLRADRAALANALQQYNASIGAGDATLAHCDLLSRPETLAVVTGQQPGLLTGPLYTIYKALSTVTLAKRLSDELGRPCVPVFGVEGDDTDRSEIDWAEVTDPAGELQRIILPVPEEAVGGPVSAYPIADAWQHVVNDLESALPASEFRGEILSLVRSTGEQSATQGEWFARLMSRLFDRGGLVMMPADHPELKRLMAPVFAWAIEHPLAATDEAMRTAEELRSFGYDPQVHKLEGSAAFFVLQKGRRLRVTYRDSKFELDSKPCETSDLRERLRESPRDFDCNVLLRPIAQDYLLPTVAYVAGPHEIAYFAQIAGLYRAIGVAMPVIVPRIGATIVPGSMKKLLQETGADPLGLRGETEAVASDLIRSQRGEEISTAFASAREQARRLGDELRKVSEGIDSTLSATAEGVESRLLREIERLEDKALKALKRQDEQFTARIARAQQSLYPRGELQERVLNITSLLARYGIRLMEELEGTLAGSEGEHCFVSPAAD